jgi:hypothetical protein
MTQLKDDEKAISQKNVIGDFTCGTFCLLIFNGTLNLLLKN